MACSSIMGERYTQYCTDICNLLNLKDILSVRCLLSVVERDQISLPTAFLLQNCQGSVVGCASLLFIRTSIDLHVHVEQRSVVPNALRDACLLIGGTLGTTTHNRVCCQGALPKTWVKK